MQTPSKDRAKGKGKSKHLAKSQLAEEGNATLVAMKTWRKRSL
jgi:hypothetical protein